MEQVKVELGSVTYSKHFELTYVSGMQKIHPFLDVYCDVRRINCELMGVILAELEHDPDTLHSFEQRLQSSIWCWVGVNPGHESRNIEVTLDEGCCDLLPHGVWKRVNISINCSYFTVLGFRVRKKVQLKSLMELSSIAVARCLLVESDCNLLEVPQDLIPDIRRGFQNRWIHRPHRVKMYSGLHPLYKFGVCIIYLFFIMLMFLFIVMYF